MCGILGHVTFSGAHPSPAAFDYALRQLRHRGPDDQGAHRAAGPGEVRVSMGQTRLSILDLSSAGHQPMFSPRSGACVVFNGEVYNFRELRAKLETKGYTFSSQCDTEVVLAAYDEYGEDFSRHFFGMFAIAVWDMKRQRLVLTRDRLGIKPFYYYWDQNQFAWGSEVSAIAALPGLRLEVDPAAVRQCLLGGYITHPMSIYRQIRKLPAGHRMTIELARPDPRPIAYWNALDYYAAPRTFRDEGEVLDALRAELTAAVRRRLISDVPLGAFLSGGIDSSLIVALMRSVHSGTVRTFTIGFDDGRWNEAPQARAIARHLGTQHEEHVVSETNVLDLARTTADYLDEPFADPSMIPTMALCRMTRRHVTVALSGDGGDELFWGYLSYTNKTLDWFPRFNAVPRAVRGALSAGLRALPGRRWRVWGQLLTYHDLADYAFGPTVWRPWEYPQLLRQAAPGNRNVDIAREVMARLKDAPIDVLTGAVDVQSYLVDNCLTKVDRASMAFALEARVPILDHHVVQLAASIPIEFKTAGRIQKRLLKQLLGERVPRALWERPKKGFGVPLVHWFRTSLRDWARDELFSPSGQLHDWLNRAELERVWNDHQSGRQDRADLIWSCLQLAGWERRMRRIEQARPAA